MRTVSFDVPPQEVLTKDSVTVAVDAVGNLNIKENNLRRKFRKLFLTGFKFIIGFSILLFR